MALRTSWRIRQSTPPFTTPTMTLMAANPDAGVPGHTESKMGGTRAVEGKP
jgi:hypothetical protein